MTEDEYRASLRVLSEELRQRASTLVDYLVSQPPKALAMQEARAFAWWCLEEGTTRIEVVQEHERRRRLARQGATQHKGATHAR